MKKFTKIIMSMGIMVMAMSMTFGVSTKAEAAKKTIKVSTKSTTIKIGKKKTIKVKNTKKFTVKSNKKKIATVKKSGKKFVISGKKTGKARITVKAKGMKSVTVKVTVKKTVKKSSNNSKNTDSSKNYKIINPSADKLNEAQKAAGSKINVKFSDSDKDHVDGDTVILSKNDSIKYKSFYFDDNGKIIHYTAEVTDYAERIAIAYFKKIDSFGSFSPTPKIYENCYKSLKAVYKKDGFWCFDVHTADGMAYYGRGLEID